MDGFLVEVQGLGRVIRLGRARKPVQGRNREVRDVARRCNVERVPAGRAGVAKLVELEVAKPEVQACLRPVGVDRLLRKPGLGAGKKVDGFAVAA